MSRDYINIYSRKIFNLEIEDKFSDFDLNQINETTKAFKKGFCRKRNNGICFQK